MVWMGVERYTATVEKLNRSLSGYSLAHKKDKVIN